jgi:large subunit ribosomal protein L2
MITPYSIKFLKKKLIKGIKETGGRNFLGRVTIRGQGGGDKRLYRYIDYYRRLNQFGMVVSILYDPNRTCKIGLVLFENGLSSFILIQKDVIIGQIVYIGSYLEDKAWVIKSGFALSLYQMPLYSILSNIEFKPLLGKSLCRAADTNCMLVGVYKNKGVLKLNSGWELHLSLNCISSFGSMSTRLENNICIEKAGKNRSLGFKPKVRGVAKNPCDHPHGGGNGKRSKPKIPVNAWHTVFKWKHTKHRKIDNKKRRLFKVLN